MQADEMYAILKSDSVSKNQGIENEGKVMYVNQQGNLVPVTLGLQANIDEAGDLTFSITMNEEV